MFPPHPTQGYIIIMLFRAYYIWSSMHLLSVLFIRMCCLFLFYYNEILQSEVENVNLLECIRGAKLS